MTDLDNLISDFGTWIKVDEANHFLQSLGIDPFQNAGYSFLQKITESIITQVPFHNLFLLTRPPAAPTSSEIREDMLSLKGGPCGTMNTFLGALLRIKGFEVDLVSATMMEPDCHLGLMVRINTDFYYVDVGDGKPYYEPFKVGETIIRTYPSHTFRSFTDGENLLIQYLDTDGNWDTTCTVHLAPRKFSFFEASIEKHYTHEQYGPFSRNLRLVKYPDRKILGLRNFTFLKEENERYFRIELPNIESLRETAESHFGQHQLPTQQAIDLLVEKGAL